MVEEIIDYGLVSLNIKKIMDEKNLSINQMSIISGLKYDVVANYYNNNNNKYS